jgi:hypothetical protein
MAQALAVTDSIDSLIVQDPLWIVLVESKRTSFSVGLFFSFAVSEWLAGIP